MQYQSKVLECKRKSNVEIKKETVILILLFLGGISISRVVLLFNNNTIGIAPFGVAYLMATSMQRNCKNVIMSAFGCSIGYITVIDSISGKYAVLLELIVVAVYSIAVIKSKIVVSEKVMFFLVSISYLGYVMLRDYNYQVDLALSLINIAVIIPVYYIVKYGVKCLIEFNNNYFFTAEDFLSMSIIICLLVSGMRNLFISNVSIQSISGFFMVLLVACTGGTTFGATIGITMGIIVGISSGDLTEGIILYGLIGLISGIFKQAGKKFVALAYLITYLTICIYFEQLSIYSIIQCFVVSVLVLIIPSRIYIKLECELDSSKKNEKLNDLELQEVKNQFSIKVKKLNNTIESIFKTLDNMSENENLNFKSKSAGLIENLSNRVCSKCTRSRTCWERDFNVTYNSFEKLIKSCEDNRIVFPHQLEKVCFEKFQLIKGADSLVTSLKSNEIYKNRLIEGRMMTAKHLRCITSSIEEMIEDFNTNIKIDNDMQRILKKELNKNMIYPKKVFCYIDENIRSNIKLVFENCQGSSYCNKEVLPIINKIINTKMEIGEGGCKIKRDNNECSILFVEAPKFKAISYAAVCTKSTERCSGDSYSFEKCTNDKYVNVISDGMGFGPQASKQSLATIEMIEKYMESGFKSDVAIDMINDVMTMKFEEDERFSTLDLNIIDLYSGEAEFIKVGAISSFIKRGKNIKAVSSNMPPFGTVDKIEIDKVKIKLKNGDLIIMISDGIVDVDKNHMLDYTWLEDYLVQCTKDPKKLALEILEKAKELSGKNIQDDMTVLVCKIQADILAD